MARHANDGRGRIGGRQAGTPNKVTSDLRAVIKQLISENVEQIRVDLALLEPKERLDFLEKLMQYVIPKAIPASTRERDELDWDDAMNVTL